MRRTSDAFLQCQCLPRSSGGRGFHAPICSHAIPLLRDKQAGSNAARRRVYVDESSQLVFLCRSRGAEAAPTFFFSRNFRTINML